MQLIRRAQRITGDPKREGNGLLKLLDAGLTYEDITLDQALEILVHQSKIDSPNCGMTYASHRRHAITIPGCGLSLCCFISGRQMHDKLQCPERRES